MAWHFGEEGEKANNEGEKGREGKKFISFESRLSIKIQRVYSKYMYLDVAAVKVFDDGEEAEDVREEMDS